MKKGPGESKNLRGFTLVEAMVVVFIVAVTAVAFYSVFAVGTRYIIDSKNRLEATALANEKMETIRNLDYADIGTEEGIPSGEIVEEEEVFRGTRIFYVKTLVRYVDDSYDGTEDGSPDDAIPNDYKSVRVKVSWDPNPETNKTVYLVSTFVPEGIEKPESGGTLSINVINNQGIGIPQALVHISNPSESVNINTATDSTGNITFVGAPGGDQNYLIEVSKSGYYGVKTYPPYPTSSWNPADVHGSVVEGRLNMKSIMTDKLSDLMIRSEDTFGQAIPSVEFDIKGGKKIGDTVAEESEEVFDFELVGQSTGSSGEKIFSDRSFGMYYFTPGSLAGYKFLKLDNGQTKETEINLLPDNDLEVKAVFAKEDVNSLLVRVKTGETT
ncbi:MAG: prepilin-type N-terminal cleavage/methylation domain-containing protein, partial [Patescibacteria group bacterium]